MKKLLWNPFEYYAGVKALIIGLSILVISSIVGYLSCTHFPDLLSVKVGYPLGMYVFFLENLVAWLASSLVFYLLAVIFSKSKVRIIDFLGTMALARWPYLLASFAGFVTPMLRFSEFIKYHYLGQGEKVELSAFDLGFTLLTSVLLLLIVIWYVALMYHAYRVSSNLKKEKLVISFILGVILSLIASMLVVGKFIVNPLDFVG